MIDLVCIGDSLTFGYGIDKSYCWIELLKNSLNISILNKGINGNTSTDMLCRFYEDVVSENPSKVIIFGGTNDFFIGYTVTSVMENILLMCKEAMENNIMPIVICPPPVEENIARLYWDEYIN